MKKKIITTATALLLLMNCGVSVFASNTETGLEKAINTSEISDENTYDTDGTVKTVEKTIELSDEQKTEIDKANKEYFNSRQTRTIIGTDDRVTVTNSDTRIAKLLITFSDGSRAQGTGFLVGRSQFLMTAAHCIYNNITDKWASSIQVIPGSTNSSEPLGSYWATNISITAKWSDKNISLLSRESFDYGWLKLDRAMPGTTALQLEDYRNAYLGYSGYGDTVNIQGYPDEAIYSRSQLVARSKDVLLTSAHLFYKIDTTGGQSGSPIRVNNSDRVVAIHTNGVNSQATYTDRNYGVLIKNEIIDATKDFIDTYR